jgi:FkbH-like protein
MKLHWLSEPADFRARLRGVGLQPDPTARLQELSELAQHQLDALQTIQISKLLPGGDVTLPAGWSRAKVAVLASHTVEHLLPGIRVAGLRRRILVDIHLGAYGQYRQELSDPSSSLFAFAPQYVLFAIAAQEVLQSADATEAVGRTVDELRGLWKIARQTFNAAVIQQTFIDTSEPLFGHHDRLVEAAPARVIGALNERVIAAAREDGVLLLDIDRLAARDGRDSWFELSHWYASKLLIAPRAAPLYGDHLLRVVAARLGQSRKCLVLDLDNTLWGGIVGDDGVQGLVLGQGSAQGEAHLALQRYAKQLRDRGVILAVCSKNEHRIAEEAFSGHPEMLLKMQDIAAFFANWEDKAANITAIASQLNIGLDSLVFVDDNPAERQRVRSALPQVAVPELPDDITGYVRCIADAGYFESVSFTEEDRNRGAQYAANSERDALRGRTQSLDEFRRDLAMTLRYGRFTQVDLARVTQLINKTNQFNVSVRRYTQQEIESFATDAACLTLQFRLSDRFGDNGLIAAMVCRAEDAATLQLDTWVMSCRVFGRDVETEIMNVAVDTARALRFRTLNVNYLPTPRNGLVRDLLPRLGLVAAAGPDDSGAELWTLQLADYVRQPTHIHIEAEAS